MTRGSPAGPARTGLRRIIGFAALLAACAVALTAAFGWGGPLVFVITAELIAAAALLTLLGALPHGHPAPAAESEDEVAWPTLRRRARAVVIGVTGRWVHQQYRGVQAAEFPAYLKISSDLGWAPVSTWHYDHGTRPLLARVTRAVLAERHQVDLTADPEAARRLLGDEVWALVDPSRPPSHDSRTPGPNTRAIARIVERLEQL